LEIYKFTYKKSEGGRGERERERERDIKKIPLKKVILYSTKVVFGSHKKNFSLINIIVRYKLMFSQIKK